MSYWSVNKMRHVLSYLFRGINIITNLKFYSKALQYYSESLSIFEAASFSLHSQVILL